MNTQFHFSKSDFIVVLTGAGISAESGIRTFRDNNGLWENHPVDEVATPEGFITNPKLVWRFYKQRFFQLSEVSPNPGHYALVKLEEYMGDNFCLITQNVDGLHRSAGSKKIYEMHGQLEKAYCINCHSHYSLSEINLAPEIPKCLKCNAYLRPDIVWFGEEPYYLPQIDQALRQATHFITIGTSGIVYPAAQFLMYARSYGVQTIGINLAEPDNRAFIKEFHQGKSGELLPLLVDLWTK
ncbi:MAG TPA: NAD-dependent deacylase [Candidatus Cloacimonadota bacterium]|mgnify:CR=1 FL=1|nr:NAD-dependent deacylase [Candidatus Cloacimonadota bacterium]